VTDPQRSTTGVDTRGSASAPAPDRNELLRRLRRRAHSLPDRLSERIFGQPEAVARVSQSVRRAAAGLSELRRPLGSFLFVGPTGTGKTEMARAMAEEVYANPDALIRLDCSDFSHGHEISRLMGSPPGYVGYESGGSLTKALRRNPRAVVLFDEVEKAHSNLHNLMLQILDEGQLADQNGDPVSFDQALVVLTSNAGATELHEASQPLGFQGCPLEEDAVEEITGSALFRHFSPEFLGRIDERVTFLPLTRSHARSIARRELGLLAKRLVSRPVRVRFTRAVADWVAERAYADAAGARGIRAVIRREIEAPLADKLLALGSRRKTWLVARVRRGKLALEAE